MESPSQPTSTSTADAPGLGDDGFIDLDTFVQKTDRDTSRSEARPARGNLFSRWLLSGVRSQHGWRIFSVEMTSSAFSSMTRTPLTAMPGCGPS